MIDVTPLEDLGHADHGWLDARHHFSFANYYDPDRMGFGPLRVWNDDVIKPGKGFPMHPHADMEIITYLRKGEISHEDNLGNKGVTVAGDVQVMSAGTGIVHSEYNRGEVDTELFQIWIETDRAGHEPRWDAKKFLDAGRGAVLEPLASGRKGHDDALMIHQDAALFGATLEVGDSVTHTLEPGRRAYVVAVGGAITINGTDAPARAGVAVSDETDIVIVAKEPGEVVLLDLP
ncbi:MAG: pirin family protein [Rhodospirillaceae bacterium]|nr:pirin family protein [Rhodospirillaceae bacterium]